jgi:DNA-binding transcriptional regulator YiaG
MSSKSSSGVASALQKAVNGLDTIHTVAPVAQDLTKQSASSAASTSFPPNDPAFPAADYNDIVKGVVKDIDLTRKEQYLNNMVFAELFGCSKAEFATWAKWKQVAKKKQLNLF